MNLSCGMKMVWEKLPEFLQQRWRKTWHHIQATTCQPPYFFVFIDFLSKVVEEFSIPGFNQGLSSLNSTAKPSRVLRTSVEEKIMCNHHENAKHELHECRSLSYLPFSEVKQLAFSAGACFKCLRNHKQQDCTINVKCDICNLSHVTPMQKDVNPHRRRNFDENTRGNYEIRDQSSNLNQCKNQSRIQVVVSLLNI